MAERIKINENGLHIVLEISGEGKVYLLHCGSQSFREADIEAYQVEKFSLVQLQLAGCNQDEHHGCKHTGTMPGNDLRYISHADYRNLFGRKLEISMRTEDIGVKSHIQFMDDIKVIRTWNEVIYFGKDEVTIEYISTFALTGCFKEGIQPWDKKAVLHIPHNTWGGEVQWRRHTLPELGLSRVEGTAAVSDPLSRQNYSMKRISLSANGTWGCSEYLPMGCLENEETGNCLTWQIEQHSAWHAEVSDTLGQVYLLLSGPTENENHWYKTLKHGESFKTVKAAVAFGNSYEQTIGELTKYRRKIRRPNKDNEFLGVIFNDYMNCLYGNPTTEKLIPLIDAAAEAGCEYFCIDAGWYADGVWWDEVGEWIPSKKRFPNGISEPIQYILEKGMIPGLWLELEVMGVNCPLAKRLPDNWFFIRHGKRIIDHGRYQLDFRNPEVRKYADDVLARLISGYGAGYIKMDYNINAGIGTEYASDSVGDGLLEHTRCYLEWLREKFEDYPELIIENCSSGGMRMAYSLLELQSIQSTSDQIDYKKYAAIAAASPSAVTPEQSAVWSYPTSMGDEEETIFNMVNAILLRIHQSGHLSDLSPKRFSLVKEGIGLYKRIRIDLKDSLPVWPTGIPVFDNEWISYGAFCGNKIYLAVWRTGSADECFCIPFRDYDIEGKEIKCIYPKEPDTYYQWNTVNKSLSVRLPVPYCARLFEIR